MAEIPLPAAGKWVSLLALLPAVEAQPLQGAGFTPTAWERRAPPISAEPQVHLM